MTNQDKIIILIICLKFTILRGKKGESWFKICDWIRKFAFFGVPFLTFLGNESFSRKPLKITTIFGMVYQNFSFDTGFKHFPCIMAYNIQPLHVTVDGNYVLYTV